MGVGVSVGRWTLDMPGFPLGVGCWVGMWARGWEGRALREGPSGEWDVGWDDI
jgi:hypothetical protein